LLGLEGMDARSIRALLDAAERWRRRWREDRRPHDALLGVEVVNAFFEDSTRTRTSFELAERRLGATPITFVCAGSSVSKGESLLDTLRTLVAMGVDTLVIRHRAGGAAAHAAAELPVSVVNAGDGSHEHPTQGLLDLLSLRDAWGGRFEGRTLAIVGDIAHSRVARSAIFGLTALGARVRVAGPASVVPRDLLGLGCDVAGSIDEALDGADGAMALRLQIERMEHAVLPSLAEYARGWGLTAERVRRMKPDAVVMHPGPMNRGVEIASDVADGARSVVFRQVENGVAVRAAVLAWCAGREEAA
jgi:aspartate carbamoyltransferase catalytic subunit